MVDNRQQVGHVEVESLMNSSSMSNENYNISCVIVQKLPSWSMPNMNHLQFITLVTCKHMDRFFMVTVIVIHSSNKMHH